MFYTSKLYIIYHILGFILVLRALPVKAADFCTYNYGSKRYCDYGCCGNIYSSYDGICCTYNLTAIIVGSVIAGLVVIGVLIAFIVFCCVYASKSGTHRGAVVGVQPANTTQTVASVAYTSGPTSYPGSYGPGMYGYPAGMQPAPPYTFNNGASGPSAPPYPPPPAKYY